MSHPPLKEDEIQIIENSIDQLKLSRKYRSRILEGLSTGSEVILNYHSHKNNKSFCVSVLISSVFSITSESGEKKKWIEIAHIKKVGYSADRCAPIMKIFGNLFKIAFNMEKLPSIYFEGKIMMKDE